MSLPRTWLIAATALFSLSSVALGSASTQAEEPAVDRPAASARAGGLDVTLSARGFHVTSGSCVDVPFVVRHDRGYLDRFTAEVEVWHGRKFVTDTFDYVYETSRPLRASFFLCPSDRSDLGTFRLGPTKGEWNDYDGGIDATYADASRTALTILQHSRFTRPVFGRSAAGRTASSTLTYFDVATSAYRNAPSGTRVDLQKQMASGAWVKVASGKVAKSGRATVTFRNTAKQNYRMVSGRTSYTWNATSSVVRR